MTDKSFFLSLKDTNVLKGVALLMLLFHHLFYVQKGLYDDIQLTSTHALVQDIGIWCKLCVAIFIFLSGYGLTVGAMKTNGITNLRYFYWHRFTKLLLNYWFIWLIFVPVSVFVFGRTFSDAYQSHIIPKLILDFFGIINCFGWYGYNATWWFYSCIIVLYFCFPFLYRMQERNPILTMATIVSICFLPTPLFASAKIYFASFYMGMVVCRYQNNTLKITPPNHQILWWIVFALLSVERFIVHDVLFFDAFLTLALVMTYKSIRLPQLAASVFNFFGKHSMNIFLFHTFIYYYWFRDFIYASRNPIIIYLILLAICLVVSLTLEYIKKIILFDKFVNYIDSLYGIR